jgi:transcriptional regulator with XRE-family HTH domain
MNMARLLNEKIAELPAGRREKIEERAAELIAEEMSLRELRKAMGKTQAKVAEELGVGQDSVARYEQRSDMLLSTLSEYVRRVGGTLELRAHFPDRKPIRIKGFGELSVRDLPKAGEMRSKRSDTLVRTLRGEYGPAAATPARYRADTQVGTIRERKGEHARQSARKAK